MNNKIKNRVLKEAKQILQTNETIREISNSTHVSKSTVHKDLQERLKKIDKSLYIKVNQILYYHTHIRHIRGGEATRRKYLSLEKNTTNI